MDVFVIHRFRQRRKAKDRIRKLAAAESIRLRPRMLRESRTQRWRAKATKTMAASDAVIVFDPTSCRESPNARWEIEEAGRLKKPIFEISKSNGASTDLVGLVNLYNFQSEFDSCFEKASEAEVLPLYQEMLASSEALIQRRQRTNAFFISVLGALLAVAGFVLGSGAPSQSTAWVLHAFALVGLLLCRSWINLIDNYGKLNRAKFEVILRLEKHLGARIYDAEWISLGKGVRPDKYRSFTSTERSVPWLFGGLIAVLQLGLVVWQIWG